MNENTNLPLILDEIPQHEQRELLEKVAMQVVKRRLTVPAILFLEMYKPLNFLGSQVTYRTESVCASDFQNNRLPEICINH